MNDCAYCYTGMTGRSNLQEGEYRRVATMLHDGPFAEPTRIICNECYEKKIHLSRSICGWCGKLKPLLFTENTSMTTSWVYLGNSFGALCGDCKSLKLPVPPIRKFPTYTILTDDDIEILKRCWRDPAWKKRTKMPPLRRSIDD